MGASKKLFEKQELLESYAKTFLFENNYIEEALDGHLCTQTHSDNNEVFIKANKYFNDNELHTLFSLTEFRDQVKYILDISEFIKNFDYDLKRMK